MRILAFTFSLLGFERFLLISLYPSFPLSLDRPHEPLSHISIEPTFISLHLFFALPLLSSCVSLLLRNSLVRISIVFQCASLSLDRAVSQPPLDVRPRTSPSSMPPYRSKLLPHLPCLERHAMPRTPLHITSLSYFGKILASEVVFFSQHLALPSDPPPPQHHHDHSFF